MTPEEWDHLRYFSPAENWGEPSKMNFGLLWLLDSFREYTDRVFVVSCGTQGSHIKNSEHYTGKAVDGVVEAKGISKLDLIHSAFRFPFTGIGIYPKAKCQNMIDPLGFHFDCRDVAKLPRGITQAVWIGIPEGKDNKYYAFNEENLRKFGII